MYTTSDYRAERDASSELPVFSSDLVVALGQATVSGATLFGLNYHQNPEKPQSLILQPRREHVREEILRAEHWKLPQCRRTFATLGNQPQNAWGYLHGVNENQVAVGFSTWQSRLPISAPGMEATDLVRLTLERSTSARHATDLLTDFIRRHGQRGSAAHDHIFLVADGREALVVEAADRYWTLQEIGSLRAVSDVGVIRQDWDRISSGFADYAISRQWCSADGSKVDFNSCVGARPEVIAAAMRRWGRATYLLEQQNGCADTTFLRGLLSDHYDATRFAYDPFSPSNGPLSLCRHARNGHGMQTAGSLYVELRQEPSRLFPVWFAFGPPCVSMYFPVFLSADILNFASEDDLLPTLAQRLEQLVPRIHKKMAGDGDDREMIRNRLSWLQAQIDEMTADFVPEAQQLFESENQLELQRSVRLQIQSHLEKFEHAAEDILGVEFKTGEAALIG